VPPSVVEAATLLGADRRAVRRRVELPLVRPALVAGAGLALVACLGEFGATVFLTRSDRVTVPVAIERLLSRPGPDGFGQAMALSCVLVLLSALVLAAVDRIGGARAATAAGPTGPGDRTGLRLGL
jgi:thiamine transport system permease protein